VIPGLGAGKPGTAVIKIGGGLSRVPHALERVCAAVNNAACGHSLVVVPGGGPFADAVRSFERQLPISTDAAHWMAILAMDQYGHVLADRIARAELVEEPGTLAEVLGRGRVAVLAPSRWMRSADVLPHSWDVTSDSIAAFIAGALGATRLILIKMTEVGDPVDPYFRSALPVGLPYEILGWERIEELPARLSG
jgi:5-(aminomethyl)-3-furanmethanol phosphate kinase